LIIKKAIEYDKILIKKRIQTNTSESIFAKDDYYVSIYGTDGFSMGGKLRDKKS